MSASAESIRSYLATVAEEHRFQYFRIRLKHFEQDVSTNAELFAQFREWLNQLNDEAILKFHQRHYNPTYLNLLSVFGQVLTNEEVQALAIKCVKTKFWNECEYDFHLSQLFEWIKSDRGGLQFATDQNLLRLKGWDLGLIRSLLSRGRGLIICSFRFGAIRYLPIEIALLGFPIAEVVNQDALDVRQAAFNSLGRDLTGTPPLSTESIPTELTPQRDNLRLLKTVNAEDPRCTVEVVNALKRNEIIAFCIEGNTGSDGPWGDTAKSTVDFLGHRIAAKNGAARLAAALRTPILPVIALRDGPASGQLVYSEPIIPPSGLKRSENEKFVQTSMQSLYAFFESYVRRHLEQWEGWSALHRWRLRGDDIDAGSDALTGTDPQTIATVLRDGKCFAVNRCNVAQLPTKDGMMWVDIKTLKGFQNPQWAGKENVLATLSSPTGLDLAWIKKSNTDPAWEEKICLLLAYLQQSDLIAAR